MTTKPKKKKVRRGTLAALGAALGSIVLTVASDPHVITTVAGRVGISGVTLAVVVLAVKKALVRDDDERDDP